MFDKQIIRLPNSPRAIAICIVCALVHVALVCGQVFSLTAFIVLAWEGKLASGMSIDAWMLLAIFVACFSGRAVVRAVRDRFMRNYAFTQVMNLRSQLLEKTFDLGGVFGGSIGSGQITSNLIDGIHAIERYIKIIIPKTVDLMLVPFVIAIVIFTQDWISGIIVVVCYPCIIAFMRLIGYTAKDESAKRHDAFVCMSGHFLDSMRGMSTLKAFGVAKRYSQLVYEASENYRHAIMKTLRIATLSGAVLDIFATCGLAAVAIMLGFRMVDGDVLLFPALVVLMLVPEYFMAVKAYASDYHATLDGKSALEKVLGMLHVQPRHVRIRRRSSDQESASGAVAIQMSSIDGKRIALIGPSGSGKSTLLGVVSGNVLLDEGEAPVFDGNRIAFIPQSPHLISGTLRENVSLYNPTATDNEIYKALEAVGLDGVLRTMPDALDTQLAGSGDIAGSRQRSLSGGEAHRVSIARALLSNRDVWILDEPGSDLDLQTEKELHRAVAPLVDGKTLIIATHSDVWLDGIDEVIDMSNVEVFESDAA